MKLFIAPSLICLVLGNSDRVTKISEKYNSYVKKLPKNPVEIKGELGL